MVDAEFPRHDTPEGCAIGRKRLLGKKHVDSSVRLIKAVDSNAGQMVGQTNWLVFNEFPAYEPLNGACWGIQDVKEFAQQLWNQC